MVAAQAEETKCEDGGDDVGDAEAGPEEGKSEGEFGAFEEVGLVGGEVCVSVNPKKSLGRGSTRRTR